MGRGANLLKSCACAQVAVTSGPLKYSEIEKRSHCENHSQVCFCELFGCSDDPAETINPSELKLSSQRCVPETCIFKSSATSDYSRTQPDSVCGDGQLTWASVRHQSFSPELSTKPVRVCKNLVCLVFVLIYCDIREVIYIYGGREMTSANRSSVSGSGTAGVSMETGWAHPVWSFCVYSDASATVSVSCICSFFFFFLAT